jgi:hypothetical protein
VTHVVSKKTQDWGEGMTKSLRGTLIASVVLSWIALWSCNSSVAITTASVPSGTVGQPYSVQLQGKGVGTWSVLTGTLPPGLQLSTSGLLSGTPSKAVTFSFTVEARQDTTPTAPTVVQSFSVTIM